MGAVSGSPAGWATYRMSVTLKGDATNAYTIYGKSTGSLSLPAAYQCATPFGANTGGTNPAFWAVANNAALGWPDRRRRWWRAQLDRHRLGRLDRGQRHRG